MTLPVSGVGETATAATKTRVPWQLAPYLFQKGHAPLHGGGRPKGSRNALTVILDAAPLKARQYVKSTAPAVLVDSRKWIMPIDSDAVVQPVPLTRIDILLELQRRGVALPLMSDSGNVAEQTPQNAEPDTRLQDPSSSGE